jgi:hypothetical protein
VHQFLVMVDTAAGGGPAQMRQVAGRQGLRRFYPIRLLDNETVCQRSAEAYAATMGPDSAAVGVHVFRYGRAYVVNRPDRPANSIILVLNDSFQYLDGWGF